MEGKMASRCSQNLQRIAHGLSKAERKMLKKQKKALHTIKAKAQEVGEISERPTAYLLVKNGGLMCGVKREDLFSVLSEYGSLEDLVMLPGKSYSYALYVDVKHAEKAVASLNGQKLLCCQSSLCKKTLFLIYLAKKPCFDRSSLLLDKSYPTGLILIQDFINECEESKLLKHFSKSVNESDQSLETTEQHPVEKQLKHRYVKHYGYEFLYGSNTVDIKEPLADGMPNECSVVVDKITSLECVEHCPDQLTVNEYLPGQGIPPHIDTHSAFEDAIVCLSLGASVAMDFRHTDGRHVSILLPRRSVLVMTEDSRYVWTHGITPRKYDVVSENASTCHSRVDIPTDATISWIGTQQSSSTAGAPDSRPAGVTLLPRQTRVSLTFRKVRATPCDCKFPSYCDSRKTTDGANNSKNLVEDGLLVPVTDQDAVDLEQKHVYDVYENIAEHFSGTRHSPWPRIAEFLKEQRSGSLVADVGCGNGKYLGINDQLVMFGSDRSSNLASICTQRGFQVLVCDILNLPYRSGVFDVCICIAVIHHLSTVERRVAALRELCRIVRPGGRILVSVWALEQNCTAVEEQASKPGASEMDGTVNRPDQKAFPCKPRDIESSLVTNPELVGYGGGTKIIDARQNSRIYLETSENVDADKRGNAEIDLEMSRKVDINQKLNTEIDLETSENVDINRKGNTEIDLETPENVDINQRGYTEIDLKTSENVDINQRGYMETDFKTSENVDIDQRGNTEIDLETPDTQSLSLMDTAGQHIPVASCVQQSNVKDHDDHSLACDTGTSLKLKVNANRTKFEQQDLLVPWHYRGQKKTKRRVQRDGELSCSDSEESQVHDLQEQGSSLGRDRVFQRFYHVFKESELVNDCMKLENISIVKSYYDRGNWCVELEKTENS